MTQLDYQPYHQDEDVPSYDILLNPERGEELENEIGSINGQMEGAFKRMNITDPEVNSLMLGALWFSVYPCQEFIVRIYRNYRVQH